MAEKEYFIVTEETEGDGRVAGFRQVRGYETQEDYGSAMDSLRERGLIVVESGFASHADAIRVAMQMPYETEATKVILNHVEGDGTVRAMEMIECLENLVARVKLHERHLPDMQGALRKMTNLRLIGEVLTDEQATIVRTQLKAYEKFRGGKF